jgi:hypothetical protein
MKITFILTAIVPVLLVMKANGGGSSYMQWNDSASTWVEHVVSNNGHSHNFPYEFCTCVNSATCQHSTPPVYLMTPPKKAAFGLKFPPSLAAPRRAKRWRSSAPICVRQSKDVCRFRLTLRPLMPTIK